MSDREPPAQSADLTRVVHMDIARLEEGLSALVGRSGPDPQQSVSAALELCNYLVLADRVVFDGAAGEGRRSRIDSLLDQIVDRVGAGDGGAQFASSFTALSPGEEQERKILLDSIGECAGFVQLLDPSWPEARELFQRHRGDSLSDPHQYLFQHLETGKAPMREEADELLSNPAITGRRFYWGLLASESTFALMSELYWRRSLDVDVLRLLFARFRMQFAENRSQYASQALYGGTAEVAYHPDPRRAALAIRLHHAIARRDPVFDIEQGIMKAWYDKVTDLHYVEASHVVPVFLHLVLKRVEGNDPVSLIREVIEFRTTDVARQIRNATTVYTRATRREREQILEYIGRVTETIRDKEDLRNQEAKKVLYEVLLKSPSLDIIGAARDAYDHFKKWSSKWLKAATILGAVPPALMTNEESVRRIAALFGHPPALPQST
jgi:hypothetical protein